jgi:putative phosphoesterase
MWYKFTEDLAEAISKHVPDLFILCGDVTNDINLFDNFFKFFSSLLLKEGIEILFIPGNHDVWVTNPSYPYPSSREKYYNILPRILSRNENVHYLPSKPFIKNNKAFVGSMCWYDYSFLREKQRNKFKKKLDEYVLENVWGDKRYVYWDDRVKDLEGNKLILDTMLSELQKQLYGVKTYKDITVCTHMVPYYKFCRPSKELDLFAAYMGSNKILSLIDRYKNVKRVFFGHTHFTYDEVHNGRRFINASVGLKFQNLNKHPVEYISKRIKLIEI